MHFLSPFCGLGGSRSWKSLGTRILRHWYHHFCAMVVRHCPMLFQQDAGRPCAMLQTTSQYWKGDNEENEVDEWNSWACVKVDAFTFPDCPFAAYLLTGTFPLVLAINLIKANIFSRDWIGDRQTACEFRRTAVISIAQNCRYRKFDLRARIEIILLCDTFATSIFLVQKLMKWTLTRSVLYTTVTVLSSSSPGPKESISRSFGSFGTFTPFPVRMSRTCDKSKWRNSWTKGGKRSWSACW